MASQLTLVYGFLKKKKKKKKEKEKSYFAPPDKCYLIRSCHSLGLRAKKHFTFDSLEYTIM